MSGPPENFNGIYHFWAPSSKLRLNGLGWDSKRISRGVASENSIQCDSQSPTESKQDRRMIVIGLLLVRMLCYCFKSRQRLAAEILIMRHQLNVLRQRTPRRRLHLRWVDRALFIWLYRRYPRILDAMSIAVDPQAAMAWLGSPDGKEFVRRSSEDSSAPAGLPTSQ